MTEAINDSPSAIVRPAEQATFIPLARAYLCEDCRNIGNKASACAHCQSQAIASIDSMLQSPGSVHLKDAYLCQNCNHVGGYIDRCTHCNSESLLSIAQCVDGTFAAGQCRVNAMIEQLDAVLT
jgi:hypothetical protein